MSGAGARRPPWQPHADPRPARKQFLRIDLPEDSDVWSVFVAGRPEKPALAEGEDDDGSLLIKISLLPFRFELV